MEEIINFMSQYAVFPIALICFTIGYIIKHWISFIPNDFIPLILGVLGLGLNVCFHNFSFSWEIVLTGVASGLAATGSFETIKNLYNKFADKESGEDKGNG